jgi:predicted transcriptional regulator YheO
MLELMKQLADGISQQFGHRCEVVIHDLAGNPENSIVYIVNGHVTNRQIGSGPSKVVLETIHKDPMLINDKLGYLTRTPDGRILKSSTIYVKDEHQKIRFILSINYDITELVTLDQAIRDLTSFETLQENVQPEQIVNNVNDLLDYLIMQATAMIGKPAALMNKDEKVKAIQFLNDAGAFLITKSGDKITEYFGISKFTLYNYINGMKE